MKSSRWRMVWLWVRSLPARAPMFSWGLVFASLVFPKTGATSSTCQAKILSWDTRWFSPLYKVFRVKALLPMRSTTFSTTKKPTGQMLARPQTPVLPPNPTYSPSHYSPFSPQRHRQRRCRRAYSLRGVLPSVCWRHRSRRWFLHVLLQQDLRLVEL